MLALTDQPHDVREFTNQMFFEMVNMLGNPMLAGSMVDLADPEPWNLYAPPLTEMLPRLQALLTPTCYMPILNLSEGRLD
jgi:hypothetical protein